MFKRLWMTLLVLLILAGCSEQAEPTTPLPSSPQPTATLGNAQVQTTSVPDAQQAAKTYLDSWLAEDYGAMYALLTQVSRDAITLEDFTVRYQNVVNEAALSSWEYSVLSSLVNPRSAQVGYRVILHSVLVGDIQADTAMNLSLEDGGWRVQWDDTLILPELRGGNYLRMDYSIPSRANIYASDGRALVAQADAVAIGLDTGRVDQEYQESLLRLLYELTGVHPESLGPRIDAWRPYGYYLPVADVSVEALKQYEAALAGYAGVILSSFQTRYYFDEGISPHLIGYMSLIQPDEVDNYRRLGYRIDERVGRDGLEYWGEEYLAGQRGGTLYVVAPDNSILTTLAERAPEPAQAIYTTIDYDLQLSLQRNNALSDGMLGAIVVMEVDTGRVRKITTSAT
jgi:hypothetical protein